MKRSKIYCFLCFLNTCIQALGFTENPRDLQTTRANTLMDDADDIQRQLNNEGKDRVYYGGQNTIWVLHFPIGVTVPYEKWKQEPNIKQHRNIIKNEKEDQYNNNILAEKTELAFAKDQELDWTYKDQSKWAKSFPSCGGLAQSPINMPTDTLVRSMGARMMLYSYYRELPKSMTIINDGRTVSLTGEWAPGKRPIIYGGATHNRRYKFHSLVFHWPSEHTVGGLPYPMESQVIHISVDYRTLDEAVNASRKDKLAILTVANIYEYSGHDQDGLPELFNGISRSYVKTLIRPMPLSTLSPPLKEYAAYEGSLSMPPCTESVLWLVRARSLPITRKSIEALHNSMAKEPGQIFFRIPQKLNDRRIFYFNN